MKQKKQNATHQSKRHKKISEVFKESKESDFFSDIDFYHLMKGDEWVYHDFEKELEGEFDEEACLDEVNEREAIEREDALSLEEVRFDIEEPDADSTDTDHFYD